MSRRPSAVWEPRGFAHDINIDLAQSEPFRLLYEAEKRLYLHEAPDHQAAASKVKELALTNPVARTIIFVEEPEKALKLAQEIEKGVGKDRVALLTGTMRGLERDRLVNNPVFHQFARPQTPQQQPLYLVTTSAAEVGVNISGERLVTRLVESDRLLQRLGRLNRFGDQSGEPHRVAEAHIVHVPAKKGDQDKPALAHTLEYLRSLPERDGGGHDVSCRSLREQPPPPDSATEDPATARLDRRLLDLWSQTSAQAAAIPNVAPWLHGKQEDIPETHVAWRAEVSLIALDPNAAKRFEEEALISFRVLPKERLKEPTRRVREKLKAIAEQQPGTMILFQARDGSVTPVTVEVAADDNTDLEYGLVLLPPGCGGLQRGMFRIDPEADAPYDVADEEEEDKTNRRRRYLIKNDGGVIRLGASASHDNEPLPLTSDRGDLMKFANQQDLGVPLKITILEASSDEENFLVFFPPRSGKRASDLKEVDLEPHCRAVSLCAKELALKLGLTELTTAFETAGNLHDQGKATKLWQRAMGGDADHPKAKTVGRAAPALLAGFRHELASLVIAAATPGGDNDLMLHLIGSHHGWGRPHWEAKAYNRENHQQLCKSEQTALEAARRFARLQRKWGPWGLAWLEALLKAADALASEGAPNA